MKLILLCLLFICSNAIAQTDCAALDNFDSFHGIKFGETFPDHQKEYFVKDTLEDGSTIIYTLQETWSKTDPNYKQFDSWFKIGSRFSSIDFYCTKDEKIFQVVLVKHFKQNTPIVASANNHPRFYEDVIDELKTLFGSPAVSNKKEMLDGATFYSFFWVCNRIAVDAYYTYKGKEGDYAIMIFDHPLKKKHELDRYK